MFTVRWFVPPRAIHGGLFLQLCVRTDWYVSMCTCVLGVPISKIAPLANEVTLYNRDAPSMVLNEIG